MKRESSEIETPGLIIDEERCPNCGAPRMGNFCQECGQKRTTPDDLTFRRIFSDVLHEVTDFDAKIFTTFKSLLLRPGHLTAEYLAGRGSRYLAPVKLYLIVSAVYFLFAWDASLKLTNSAAQLQAVPQFQSLPLPPGVDRTAFLEQWFERTGNYSSYFRFGSVIALSFALAALYFNRRRYYGEHLTFALHYYAFDFALFSILIGALLLWQLLTGHRAPPWTLSVGGLALPIYGYFALRKVYRESTLITVLKALALLVCDFALTGISDLLALVSAGLVTLLSLKH